MPPPLFWGIERPCTFLGQMKTLENDAWIPDSVVKRSGSSRWMRSASTANAFSQPQRSRLSAYTDFQVTENTSKPSEVGFSADTWQMKFKHVGIGGSFILITKLRRNTDPFSQPFKLCHKSCASPYFSLSSVHTAQQAHSF